MHDEIHTLLCHTDLVITILDRTMSNHDFITPKVKMGIKGLRHDFITPKVKMGIKGLRNKLI